LSPSSSLSSSTSSATTRLLGGTAVRVGASGLLEAVQGASSNSLSSSSLVPPTEVRPGGAQPEPLQEVKPETSASA
jgi:hypothetical protein